MCSSRDGSRDGMIHLDKNECYQPNRKKPGDEASRNKPVDETFFHAGGFNGFIHN